MAEHKDKDSLCVVTKPRLSDDMKVYLMFLIILLVATLTVVSKVMVYDWWWRGEEGFFARKQGASIVQAKYSNIMYTGNGFIPDNYLEFHTRLHQRARGG